ncbi:hypothetical protein ACFOSC_27905 [Streptantibioticus rubrisoli]|uniref:Uncharacterized protein n=1 Tax=Streptantibioticus rubrisoli TaxID=1387313 RepID=A0ABT1PNJ6_9ACTN|nr:hypothetical protein [Streptantibioticus rubrisoli]MCQ4045823.1 hypothetical protein [Streptantibioticus rubrisoli]
MNTPERFDPALYLAATQQQVTTPTAPAVAPLPVPRTGWRWLWDHAGRIAPGLLPTIAAALATTWHQQLPANSTEPLWLMGTLTTLAGGAGIIAAAKQHGDKAVMGTAFAAAGTCATVGVAAWTPHWPVAVLMWLANVAAAYALCAPHWRSDRRDRAQHERAVEMEHVRGYHQWRDTATRAAAAVETAHSLRAAETERVRAIVAASDARTRDALLAREQRTLAPGEELNVAALLQAAGHDAPRELTAAEREEQWR